MKFKIFFVFLFFSAAVQSQTLKSLQSASKVLYSSFEDIDIEALSAFLTCDENTASANETLDTYFLNDEQKFRFVFTNAKFNFTPLQTIDGKTFSIGSFRNVVRITYFHKIDDIAAQQKILKEKFAATSVVFQKERNSFLITYTAKFLAISEASDKWKFIFLDNTVPLDLSEKCLPSNVIKKQLGL